ncbi:PilZ domain-containing protein [Bacillus sp. 03113]|uniref:PilZ domain-containing protein n=1 Tax=Bacillus sp. 03113 TaxID=2578211 RepID=UPI001144D5D0|nr:PilZ domain-containing protein [Bacillus sp. 03113]
MSLTEYLFFLFLIVLTFIFLLMHRLYHQNKKKSGVKTQHFEKVKEISSYKSQQNQFQDQRSSFRVNVNQIYCTITFYHFGNIKLQNLKNKKINGYIENISLTGLKILSDYELPVRHDISILISFKLKDFVFNLKGKIVRREDHLENKLVAYGIHFLEMVPNQQKHLNIILNRLQKREYI